MSNASLSRTASTHITVLLLGGGIQTIIRLTVLGILSRQLSPQDFGIVAAATLALSLIDLEGAIGISPAIIQRKDISEDTISTAQILAAVISISIACILYYASKSISNILGSPNSAEALQFLSISVFLKILSSVSEARLNRESKFRNLTISQNISYLAGYAITGITLAHMGFGYWSLVYAEIVQSLFQSTGLFILSPPILKIKFNRQIAIDLMRFGFLISSTKILRQFIFSIDQIVISRLLGASSLAFYTRSQGILGRPINQLGAAIETALFPALSRIQDETNRLKEIFSRGLYGYFTIVLPIIIYIALSADNIIFLILGANWGMASTIMAALAPGIFFRTTNRLCATVLKSRGRVKVLLALQIENLASMSICIFLGLHYGLIGIAIGVSSAQAIHFLSASYLVFKELNGGINNAANSFLHSTPLFLAPTISVYLVNSISEPLSISTLIISTITFALTWIATLTLTPRKILGEHGCWLTDLISLKLSKIYKTPNHFFKHK